MLKYGLLLLLRLIINGVLMSMKLVIFLIFYFIKSFYESKIIKLTLNIFSIFNFTWN